MGPFGDMIKIPEKISNGETKPLLSSNEKSFKNYGTQRCHPSLLSSNMVGPIETL